jgi:hypothetical protein
MPFWLVYMETCGIDLLTPSFLIYISKHHHHTLPRAIPKQAWYMHPVITCLLGGILPFGAVSVELFFIMSALWLHQIYYIFGFLFLVMVVLVVTCAEISILLCYFQLCNEDYRWWWRSFMSSGKTNIFVSCQRVSWLCILFLDFWHPFSHVFFRTSLCVLRTHIESRLCNPHIVILLNLTKYHHHHHHVVRCLCRLYLIVCCMVQP